MNSDTDVVRRYAKYIFLDVISFSERSAEAQSAIVKQLNAILHAALKEASVNEQDRILIPTGDGMCIAMISPQLPYDVHIQTALQILQLLSEHNRLTEDASRKFEIRIGINQNTDIVVQDVNDRANVAGAGINMASRVMDKADGNQILVSQTVHDELQPSERYISAFRSFDATGKHAKRFRVFQYIGSGHDGLNTNVPTEFVAKTTSEAKLSHVAAYYFAHAIKNQEFLVKAQCHGSRNYALTVTLWFLANDSIGEAESTVISPYSPKIFGEGKLSLDAVVKHYDDVDFDVLVALANFIQKELGPYIQHLESGGIGYVFLFVNESGKKKLQREWPAIWEGFNLG
jgi:class 3 adenylate cyclase